MKSLPDKELFRIGEVAEYFDVNKKTIYRWIDEGRLEAEKIAGKTIRIPRAAIIKCRKPHLID